MDAEDCARMANDCQSYDCVGGMCEVTDLAEGEPCGDATKDACNAADTCDGAGTCLENLAVDGETCGMCPAGPGLCGCEGGACADCSTFAQVNTFSSDQSIAGWSMTGGWGLYLETPESSLPSVPFGNFRFGTDGNRVSPYPGAEEENSSATTAMTTLPAALTFTSWHVDEDIPYDVKRIEILPEGGGAPVFIADCSDPAGMLSAFPFCAQMLMSRPPEMVDNIMIPVPAPLVGTNAQIRFSYVNSDDCCNAEQGWYIDDLNFATLCACTDDAGCDHLDSECGTGMCTPQGECVVDPVAVGTECGDTATDVECNQPDACSAAGYCMPNEGDNQSVCFDCPAGDGDCNTCFEGDCVDCNNSEPVNQFPNTLGWTFESLNMDEPHGWGIYFSAPANHLPTQDPAVPLSFAPSMGTDGNRQPPYTNAAGENGHLEHSRATSAPDIVPEAINFDSWHDDEGGGGFDNKIFELSIDGGMSWIVLEDCAGGSAQPFCENTAGSVRAGNDWDPVSIDTSAYAGEVGILRITYNTGDGCCDTEQGWFIDNLNFSQRCLDPLPM